MTRSSCYKAMELACPLRVLSQMRIPLEGWVLIRLHAFCGIAFSCCSLACHAAPPTTNALLAPAPSSPLKIQAGNLIAGDVNGDGRDDLLIPSGRSLHVMLAGPDARFAPAKGSPIELAEPAHEIALGDVNGDGRLDVVTAGHDSYAVVVMLGGGDGTFAPAPGSPFVARQPGKRPHTHGLVLADVNADGRLDVLTVNQEDDDLSLLLGDARGGFAPAPRSPFPCGPSPYPFAVADFDGDGKLDALVPNTGGATLALLRGDGSGAFAAPQRVPAPPNRPFFVAAGDFTGDGKPDAVVTHDERPHATLLVNDGRGGLTPARSSPLNLGSHAWKAAIRDVNGDRKADLVFAAKDAVRVFLGDGSGATFTPAPDSPYATGKGTWSLALGDFNGDGKPDVAATCVEEGKVAVLLQ